jgi:hypothetical protein
MVRDALLFALSVLLVALGFDTEDVAADERAAKKNDAPRAPDGKTIDFTYDAKDVKVSSLAYTGRVFLSQKTGAAATAGQSLPLIVFMYGLNRDRIPHRWMGGGNEGDVRTIIGDLIDSGRVAPAIVAGPGSIEKEAVGFGSSFPTFDFDKFVALTEASLKGTATIDKRQIIVAGHSGAGCSKDGGIVAAARAKTRPHAVISIDTCMSLALAKSLAEAHSSTHVFVTWQAATWDRPFKDFRSVFEKTRSEHPEDSGVARVLDQLKAEGRAHDQTVPQTFVKLLPRLLPPTP